MVFASLSQFWGLGASKLDSGCLLWSWHAFPVLACIFSDFLLHSQIMHIQWRLYIWRVIVSVPCDWLMIGQGCAVLLAETRLVSASITRNPNEEKQHRKKGWMFDIDSTYLILYLVHRKKICYNRRCSSTSAFFSPLSCWKQFSHQGSDIITDTIIWDEGIVV